MLPGLFICSNKKIRCSFHIKLHYITNGARFWICRDSKGKAHDVTVRKMEPDIRHHRKIRLWAFLAGAMAAYILYGWLA